MVPRFEWRSVTGVAGFRRGAKVVLDQFIARLNSHHETAGPAEWCHLGARRDPRAGERGGRGGEHGDGGGEHGIALVPSRGSRHPEGGESQRTHGLPRSLLSEQQQRNLGSVKTGQRTSWDLGLQKLTYFILSYLILSISSVRRPRHHAAAPSRSATPRRRGRHPTTRARAPSQERKKASREYWRFLSLLQLLRLQGGWVCRALDGGVSWNPSIHGPHAYPEAPRGDE